MHAQFTKEIIVKEQTDDEKNNELLKNIIVTKSNIEKANINYEFAEGKLIDYFLYTMKAEQAKLDYLISKAKLQGLSLGLIERATIRDYDDSKGERFE